MKTLLIYLVLVFICGNANAETRIWTLKSGKTIEAEFVTFLSGKVTLKNMKGKHLKIPFDQFSEEDLSFIDLLIPPKLDLRFSKTTTQRVFPESLSTLPRALYYDFSTEIKQTSAKLYNHELIAEMFIIAKEIDGDKRILIDYQRIPFTLTQGSKSVFEIKGKRAELLDYVIRGQRRGEKYDGYLIVVTDSRGEIIKVKASDEKLLKKLENLRKVPISKYFDDDCNRCYPSSPDRFY